jgi:hypothetical protein
MMRHAIGCLFVLLMPASLDAQVVKDAPPPPPAEEARKGLALGASFGGGTIAVDRESRAAAPFLTIGHSGGADFNLWVGWYPTSRFAIVAEADLVERPGEMQDPAAVGVALQYWTTRRLWLRGGVGFGELETFDATLFPVRKQGPAFSGSLGASLVQWRVVSVDLSLRIIQMNLDDVHARSIAAQIGVDAWR